MSFIEAATGRWDQAEFSLVRAIKESFGSKRAVPPIDDGWLRISSIGGICDREEVLCAIHHIDRVRVESPDSAINLEHGDAVHWMFQNKILPDLGLVGSWRCTYCGEVYGSRFTKMVPRPSRCSRCGAIAGERDRVEGRPLDTNDQAFIFVEEWIGNEEYRIGGSPDGQVMVSYRPDYKPEDLTLIEIKSTNDRNFAKYKDSPDFVHVIQTQLYLWLTGYPRAKILYFNKNDYGTPGIKEHDLEYDQECVDRVLALVKSIRANVAARTLPLRTVCGSPMCDRAKGCKVRDLCFADQYGSDT